ncbi:hypothetical protein WJX72_006117 [[Myrmecia] bisecta]|uniref:DUF455-domain-containing protein n=1 Tax=[Myrmecia] bisecta TaxID=41462 RepID=A0AAW1QFD0_9CHLO
MTIASGSQLAEDRPFEETLEESMSLVAILVLTEPDAAVKAAHTQAAVALWNNGQLLWEPATASAGGSSLFVPDKPARDSKVKLLPPQSMHRLGKGGSLASRQALVHSLAHIESWAVDLAWDVIARFGNDPRYTLPRDFFHDFVKVAEEECKHFQLLCKRLLALSSFYGALPAHDGLWESASASAHSLPARLAVEHCVHEARGLDVLPQTIHRFRSNEDEETASLLETVIYPEEVSHCAAGIRWIEYLHMQAHASHQVEFWFHALVRQHFKGLLKPPFNDDARAKAGFGPEWYLPLAAAPPGQHTN